MSAIITEKYLAGKDAFVRGTPLRSVVDAVHATNTGEWREGAEDEAMSYMFGYLEGVVDAIRQISRQLSAPGGPTRSA